VKKASFLNLRWTLISTLIEIFFLFLIKRAFFSRKIKNNLIIKYLIIKMLLKIYILITKYALILKLN